MKAIRVHQFGSPDVMRLEECPEPTPNEGQVVVRAHAVGVNPVETYIRSGAFPVKPQLPYTPGSDAAGTVEAVGQGVARIHVGDRVFISGARSGAYAEQILCGAEEIHPLPDNVDFKQGAAINIPYATAYRALHQRGHALPSEILLVHGASGAVGTAGVQLGVAFGMTTIGTAGTDRGAQLVRDQGASHVLNHHEQGYLDRLMDLTNGHGADVILEMLSDVNLANDLTVLGPGGRVIVVGCRGTIEINPRETMMREADIRGVQLPKATPEEKRSIYAALGAGLCGGVLRPIVGREMALAEAPRSHEAVLAPGAYGKIVLLP